MRKGMLLLLTAAALMAALPASAAPADSKPVEVEAVEITGSRLAEDIGDVPVPAYVITKEEIARSGARSTQEILARIPGVTGLINSASAAQSKGITIRGLNTEVLLLVDGVPAMNSSYGIGASHGSPFDLRSITPGSIERIEVVKGASSAIYGSSAAGGVINIITQKGGEQSGGSIMLEGGNAEWFRGSLRGTAVLSNDVRVTAGYTRTQEGDVKIRLLPNGAYDKAVDFRGNDFLFRVDKGAWAFVAELGDYKSEWDYTNSFTGLAERDRQKNDYRRFLVNYNDGINSGRVYYHYNEREIYDAAGVTDYDERSVGASFTRKQEIFGLPAVFGFDWRQEKLEYDNWDNPYGNSFPFDKTRNGYAPYVELTVPIGELALDIGLRYEHWNVDGGSNFNEFVPRLSLNWENPQGGLWYLTVGRFFSMPSFYQMFYSDAYWTANPDLDPEKGWSYDLGFKNLKAKNPWSVNVFYMTMNDRIDYEYDMVTYVGSYINIDKYRAWGAEAEITFNLNEKWAYTQGVAWIKADEKDAGGDWKRASTPRWDISGRLGYANGPWSGELALNWLLDREIRNNYGNYDDKDIFTVDIAVAWQNGNDRIRAACVNLFDKEYVLDSQGYITPERKFVLSYERTF